MDLSAPPKGRRATQINWFWSGLRLQDPIWSGPLIPKQNLGLGAPFNLFFGVCMKEPSNQYHKTLSLNFILNMLYFEFRTDSIGFTKPPKRSKQSMMELHLGYLESR